jgi:hypothetical protein
MSSADCQSRTTPTGRSPRRIGPRAVPRFVHVRCESIRVRSSSPHDRWTRLDVATPSHATRSRSRSRIFCFRSTTASERYQDLAKEFGPGHCFGSGWTCALVTLETISWDHACRVSLTHAPVWHLSDPPITRSNGGGSSRSTLCASVRATRRGWPLRSDIGWLGRCAHGWHRRNTRCSSSSSRRWSRGGECWRGRLGRG